MAGSAPPSKPGRPDWWLISWPTQSRFLGRPADEDGRAFGARPLSEQAGDLHDARDARRIVDGAVIDVVAVLGRGAAIGVPVGAEHHRLVRVFGSGQAADDVARLDPVGLLAEVDGHGHAVQRHGTEVGRARLILQGGEVEPGVPEQLFGDRALNPALCGHALLVRVGADDVELGGGRGILQRRPRIARARRVVDDQNARRAVRRRDLELIGPAAIEGHGLTVELARDGVAFRRAEVRVVDQHQHDLAVQVHALVVVPVALRRVDAVADEYQRRVGQGDALHRPVGRDDDVLGPLKLGRASVGRDADGGGAVLTGAADLGDLHPRP
uniref:LigA n=1 Tax=Parastrongyloides trichosuri TaxID=131310 RepID=A0A0N5A4S5_PARTI